MKTKKNILVIGAGPAGCTTANQLSKLGHAVTLIEKMDHLGGMAATFKWKKHFLDLGPHKFYTNLPETLTLVKKLLGSQLKVRPKTSKIRLFNYFLDYPVQIKDLLKKMGPIKALLFGFSFMAAQVKNLTGRQPKTSKDYLEYMYGRAVYESVFRSLSKKIWGEPNSLDVNLAKTRVPAPTLVQLITGLLFGTKNQPSVSADIFYYPKKGIGTICDELIRNSKVKVLFNKELNKLTVKNSKILESDIVISSMHLQRLVEILSPKVPVKVIKAANSLKHRSLIIVYLEFNKQRLFKDSWIFFPESQFIFNRICEQKAFSPTMISKDKTVLMVEITCQFNDSRWLMKDKEIVDAVLKDLIKAEVISDKKSFKDSNVIRVSRGYPVYDLNYQKNRQIVLNYLSTIKNLYTIGRPGLFFYNNTDHSIQIGIDLAKHIDKNGSREKWQSKLKEFFDYRIVD